MSRNAVALFVGLLLTTGLFAISRSSNPEGYDLSIKVVKSDESVLTVENPNVGACDQVNYNAYCKHAATEFPQSRLVVESDDKVFNIMCTAENRWSNCASLPVGDTFKARLEKHGLSILYRGPDGRMHKQLYEVLSASTAVTPLSAGSADNNTPRAATENPEPTTVVNPEVSNAGGGAVSATPDLAMAPAVEPEKVLCNLTSNPSGAEITLDGAYVGNTPSALALTAGSHQIEMSLPGFAQWTRKIDILPGSNLSVVATMQKPAQ